MGVEEQLHHLLCVSLWETFGKVANPQGSCARQSLHSSIASFPDDTAALAKRQPGAELIELGVARDPQILLHT